VLLSLGNGDVQNTVLETGLDFVLLDEGREVEAAGEFSNAAFGNPVLGLVGRFLRLCLCDLGTAASGSWLGSRRLFVLDCCLVFLIVRFLSSFGNAASGIGVFNKACWWSTGGVGALDAAANRHGVWIGEFNLDILLVHSGKFAVELVSVLGLSNVESWLESLDMIAAVAVVASLTAVTVKVVK